MNAVEEDFAESYFGPTESWRNMRRRRCHFSVSVSFSQAYFSRVSSPSTLIGGAQRYVTAVSGTARDGVGHCPAKLGWAAAPPLVQAASNRYIPKKK